MSESDEKSFASGYQQAPPPGYQQTPPPMHTTTLTLGILAIILAFLTGIGGVVLGIIGMVLAKKNKLTHNTTPGFVLSLIGLIFGAISFIVFLAMLATFYDMLLQMTTLL